MHRFYVRNPVVGQLAALDTEDSTHAVRVLRLREGDEVRLFDGCAEYDAAVRSTGRCVELLVLYKLDSNPEPKAKLTLYQSCPKGDKYESIIQKCTEVGVSRFVFFESARSVAHLNANKLERMHRIAYEAAKQSGRVILPDVQMATFEQALKKCAAHASGILAFEGEKRRSVQSMQLAEKKDVALIVGPEGGFDAQEVLRFTESGAQAVTLGPRILRTETAGCVLAALVLHETGDMQ